MNPALRELLQVGLGKILGREIPLDSFETYVDELHRWNQSFGLVKAGERELLVKHVLDSAAAFPYFQEAVKKLSKSRPSNVHKSIRGGEYFDPAFVVDIADFGSGAGLPGIVLALLFQLHSEITPKFHSEHRIILHLIEKQRTRSAFLVNVVSLLRLATQVKVYEKEVERIDRHFDIITSRAFAKLSLQNIELQQSKLKPNGVIIAYKGRMARISEELCDGQGKAELSGSYKIIRLSVPYLDEERHLVII